MKLFSHIYVEKKIRDSEAVSKIMAHFPNSVVIEINHYKDVFCRTKQDFFEQKKTPALILAEKKGELLYKGAKVCQSFGNEHFYYTSCIMNCIYGCEYCYLSGMYPSGNIVMFLNLEDYFDEVKRLLKEHPMYICVSYDTDLLALNGITGMLNRWIEFVDENDGVTIEIRTKCGNIGSVRQSLEKLRHRDRVIFAYTISPQEIADRYEKGTAGLMGRLAAIGLLQRLDVRCRIAFDPMIYVPGWREYYGGMLDTVFSKASEIDTDRLYDISLGSFRISESYLKNMRKNAPASAIAQFPYELNKGVYQYPEGLNMEMEQYMKERILQFVPEEKLFLDSWD